MIEQGYQMDFSKETFGVILYGPPGIGKTTTALSDGKFGADTLLINLERGASRVRGVHYALASVLTASTYEEVLQDLETPQAEKASTIVIDTCETLVNYLKDWALRTKPDAKTKSGTFNGLKGFGHVKSELESFINRIKNTMHKNVVYIFHCDEKADKDGNPVQRLRCEGSFRNTVWTGIDFGAYIQMINGKRVACFTPDQEYFAKGCHGIEGQIPIPQLKEGDVNDFLARLFEKARTNMQAESDSLKAMLSAYETTMSEVRRIVDGVVDAESANAALAVLPGLDHALTSRREASAMLAAKAKQIGIVYNPIGKEYISPKPEGDAE